MEFSLNLDQTRGLGNLQKNDIIEFDSPYIDQDIFMVLSIEKDIKIPAILLQLWQFSGGYNHALKNVMENDLGINRQVPFFTPEVKYGIVKYLKNFRPEESGLSKKEEFIFDVWPQNTSEKRDDHFNIPFEVEVEFEPGTTEILIVPSWTPLQKLPVTKIQEGSKVEIWTLNAVSNIMRVIQV